jgi:hypothetical protein
MKHVLLYSSAALFAVVQAPTASFADKPSTVATAAGGTNQAKPPEEAFDPRATKILREMGTYLASLKSFEVQTEGTDEVVLKNGSKVQVVTESRATIERPSALRSEPIGAGGGPTAGGMTAWYDGKNLTVYCKPTNTYGQVAAPGTLDAMFDLARKKYGLEAPAVDLLFADPFKVLTEDAYAGQYLGIENIDGVPAHHLAYQEKDVDWQIWVKDGPQPVPLRYVITTKTMAAQPQFTVRLTHWNTNAALTPQTFAATIPPGATRVATLPNQCPATR